MNLNSGGRVYSPSGRPPVPSRQSPRAITMTASDTMKWCSPTRVTKKPMPAPMAVQAAMAMMDAVHGSMPLRNSRPAITMASAVTDPTERSMPPEISRMVMPTTTMPSTAKAIAMARMLAQVRKILRGEGHDDEQRQDDEHQPGLAHAQQASEAAGQALRGVGRCRKSRSSWSS